MASKFKDIWEKTEMSFSTVSQYEKCPYSIYLRKIERREGEDNAYAEIGSYGHELNESVLNGEMTVQEALDDCADYFFDHITADISESSANKKYEALCDYFASFDEKKLEDFEILGVEVEFHWKVGKYNCIGFADLILRHKVTKKVYLIDHKSAGHFMKKDGTPLKNQQENFESYSNQMYLYCDAMKKVMGFYPDYIVWNHFLDKSIATVIPFDKENLNKSLKWFKETVKKMVNDNVFEAREEYVMCNCLCNYRNGLCEYKGFMDEDE